MLINKKMQDVIRVLLNEKGRKLNVRELSFKAKVSLGMVVKVVNALESSGYLKKRRGIEVTSFERLLKAWAYAVSIGEKKKIEFLAAERPQYLIKKISNLLRNEKYAFTLFSATEIIAPYVAPNKVHLYILQGKEKEISNILVNEGIMPAEEGNIVFFLADEQHFYNNQELRGVKIISLPQLYVDLFSYGGRGEEASQQILELMRDKNV